MTGRDPFEGVIFLLGQCEDAATSTDDIDTSKAVFGEPSFIFDGSGDLMSTTFLHRPGTWSFECFLTL